MTFAEAYDILANPKNVRFDDALKVATEFFGTPRSKGTSHHMFKMPWAGLPCVNLQRDKRNAKPYQVKQLVEALKKLEEMRR
jgi:hypothetical protein